MPNETPKGMPTAEDVAAHNADVARKLAAQDTVTLKPVADPGTSSALDDLVKQAEEKSKATPPAAEPPAVEAKKDDPAAPPAADTTPPATDDPVKKRAEELFKDSPSLPAGASPKSSEAFSTIKIRAAQEISAREQEIDKLKKQISDMEERAKNPTTEQLEKEKELAELKEWRAKMDVDADPKFKEFDKNINSAKEFIYDQLRKSPSITEDIINKIKAHGGPENVKLGKIFEAVGDGTIQRIVEAKVADVEQLKWQKEQAIKTAKANIKNYLAERENSMESSETKTRDETVKVLGSMLKNFSWLAEREPAKDATDAQKKAVAEENEFAKKTNAEIAAALQDNTPNMRAILIAGTARGFYVERLLNSLRAEHTALKTAYDALNVKMEKIKNASKSKLPETAAPQAGNLPAAKTTTINTHTGDALDAAAKQVMEERARKAQATA